jgi:hypothetical protein
MKTKSNASTGSGSDIEIDQYLKRAVQIEPMALEEEFVRLPADIAYWNERHSHALREYLAAKIDREQIFGRLLTNPEFHATLQILIGKRPTVEQLKGAISCHDDYAAARLHENEADVERQRLRGCIDALAAKRDMIVSLGAHIRLEMMHDPIVRRNMTRLREVDSGLDDVDENEISDES